jgi:hypothetical protein
MKTFNSHYKFARVAVLAAVVGAPLILAGCVVEPNPYYAQQPQYYDPNANVVYTTPAYAPAPAYYYAPGPSVYIGGGCCYGGWRGGGWRR